MVAALCSLITSAKIAASDWSPDTQVRKMEKDAVEVLHRTEAFLEYARQVAEVQPQRIKPLFMKTAEGDGKTGGGWTKNLGEGEGEGKRGGGGGAQLEVLWGEMEREKDAVEKCVKAMALPSQGSSSSRSRKNSLVIVDDHLIIPFLLITVQVQPF